jgi:hypothetical protein
MDGRMRIYAIVSEQEEAIGNKLTYLSRPHAEHMCEFLNLAKPEGHSGYFVEERDAMTEDDVAYLGL